MSIKNPNILSSTGNSLELNKNKLGFATSIILTLPEFQCLESDLQNPNYLVNQMSLGNIFPIHKVYEITPQNTEPTYHESVLDFSYRGYRGKTRNIVKFDLRLDYHRLLQQFTNKELRVIYCINNRMFLGTESGAYFKGFLLSNITVEDIDLFVTNTTPIRLEHDSKEELDNIIEVAAGYPIYSIDRRIVNIEVSVTNTQIVIGVKYRGEDVNILTSSDIIVTDVLHGQLDFSIFIYSNGIYSLSGFNIDGVSKLLSNGCVNITSEIYIGNQRYSVVTEATYANWSLFDNDTFVMFSGDEFQFFNTMN